MLDLDPYTGFWQSYGGSCCRNLGNYCMKVFPSANGSYPLGISRRWLCSSSCSVVPIQTHCHQSFKPNHWALHRTKWIAFAYSFFCDLCARDSTLQRGRQSIHQLGGKHLAGRIIPWAVTETFVQSSHIKAFVGLAQTPIPLFLKVVLAGQLLPLFPCIV